VGIPILRCRFRHFPACRLHSGSGPALVSTRMVGFRHFTCGGGRFGFSNALGQRVLHEDIVSSASNNHGMHKRRSSSVTKFSLSVTPETIFSSYPSKNRNYLLIFSELFQFGVIRIVGPQERISCSAGTLVSEIRLDASTAFSRRLKTRFYRGFLG